MVQATQATADNEFHHECKDIDIDVTNASVEIQNICDETLLIVEYDITNHGDESFPASTPITYGYQLEEADASDTSKWYTFVMDFGQEILGNQSIHIIDSIIYKAPAPHTLHIVLNSESIKASPNTPSSYHFHECNKTENTTPITERQNNHAKIENIGDIATINNYTQEMALDLSALKVTVQCENEVLIFQYGITNKGEANISTYIPITYVYITDSMGVNDTTFIVRHVNAVIPTGDTYTQTDTIDLIKEEFELYVILNSSNPRASTTNLDLFEHSECDAAGTATPESIYADNLGHLGTFNPCDYCNRNIEIILDDVDVVSYCDEEKVKYEYKIVNTGNSVFSANTPITYAYEFVDSLGNISPKIPFVTSLGQTLNGQDTIIHTDTIDYASVPNKVYISLNTNKVDASPNNEDDYTFLECPSHTTVNTPYEDNDGEIIDIHNGNKCCRNAEIDLTNAQIIGLCDQDKIIYQYEIVNSGNMSFPVETPISYTFKINDDFDLNADGSRVHFISNFDEAITAGDSFTQIDTLPFRGVPFKTFIKLNTNSANASAGNPSTYYFPECNYNSSDDSKIYSNNNTNFPNLDTCKQMQAFNDTIYIKSNDVFDWSKIFDNDIINFSATDINGVKHNIKEYLATLTVNQFATDGAILSNEHSDTEGEGNAHFTYLPSKNYSPDSILVDSFQYKVCHSTIPDLCDSAWVFLHYTFEVESPPQGFTANDGKGWEIPNYSVTSFPNSQLQIFNRWGNKVYDVSPYNNDWDGTNNAGNELPVGTYYYILDKHGANTTIEIGFVYLNRE